MLYTLSTFNFKQINPNCIG